MFPIAGFTYLGFSILRNVGCTLDISTLQQAGNTSSINVTYPQVTRNIKESYFSRNNLNRMTRKQKHDPLKHSFFYLRPSQRYPPPYRNLHLAATVEC